MLIGKMVGLNIKALTLIPQMKPNISKQCCSSGLEKSEVSKLISDKFPYTNPNLAARQLLTADQLANPASYPASGKLETFRDIGKAAAEIDKLVTDLKSAQ